MKSGKKLCILLICALSAIGIPVRCQTVRSAADACPDGEIRLVSFNIRQSGMARNDGPNRWPRRRAAVVRFFEQECPDVVGLQEGLIAQVRYLERALPQYARIGVGRDDGAEGGEIMAVFYRSDRFEALQSGTFWLSPTPDRVSRGWDAACNRTVTWVLLRERHTGKEFYYLNTHFDHVGETARRESALQIAGFIDDRLPADAAVILGGDLNSDISDPIFDPLKSRMQVVRQIADPTDRGGTFNGYGSAPGNIVIDHLFCRGIDTSSPVRLQTLRGDYGVPFISDHYPVAIRFRLP